MRRVQSKKLMKAAYALSQLTGEPIRAHYKELKKVHKKLNHIEKSKKQC